MDETLNEQNPSINEVEEQTLPANASDEQTPPTDFVPGDEDVIPSLPAQYSSGNAGFFNRQNESVPTAVTVGPDGALYASELSALPYPEGYARVIRVAEPEGDASFDGETPGGVAQIYASGFEQINGLTFDEDGALYVLEYVNGSTVYDPTLPTEELPPSRLIRVDTDGTREQISDEELRFGNYVFAHEGKVYAAINNGGINQGQVLAYDQNADGEWSYEVVAENLKNPRGMDIGPDGNLYVLESGEGTPADDPNAEDALSVQFIPGLVSQRAGYTAAISKIDLENGGSERIYEGLPSTIEYNPNTGEDRILSIGSNGMAINDDGTVWIASGGGLSEETATALGEFGEGLRGVLKLEGLFGEDPSQANWTPAFDTVEYAAENSPDGATTLFNTQSNLNDIEIGSDGNLYAVDAARNVMYGISPEGEEVESVTVLQKTPPVLTPPQYGLVTQAGGDPSADYSVEIVERTFKGENDLPDTPGRQQALANAAMTPTEGGTDSQMPAEPNGEAPEINGQMPADTNGEAPEINGQMPDSSYQWDFPLEESTGGDNPFGGGAGGFGDGDNPFGGGAGGFGGGDNPFGGGAGGFGSMDGEMSEEMNREASGSSYQWDFPFEESDRGSINYTVNNLYVFGDRQNENENEENPLNDSVSGFGSTDDEAPSSSYQWDFPSEESGGGFGDGDNPFGGGTGGFGGMDGEMTTETNGEAPSSPYQWDIPSEESGGGFGDGDNPFGGGTGDFGGMDGEMTTETNGEAPSFPSQGDIPFEESASSNGEPPLRGEDAAIGSILGEEVTVGSENPVDAGQITADRPTPGNPMLEPQAPADGLPAPEADMGEGADLPDDAEVLDPIITEGSPTEVPGLDPTMPPPDDFNANDFDPLNPTEVPGAEPSVLIPGPVDPLAPVVTEGNPFADYFDPFFGVYEPAEGEEPMLSNGEGSYTVDDLFVFGDRLTENGGEFGKNAVAESTGANPPFDVAPYSSLGNFTDGLNWTTYLSRILGVESYEQQDTNFSYLDATARELVNPVDPFGEATELNTFSGQIGTFEETYGTFDEDDLAIVNFGGNDLTLPPEEGVAPEEAAQQSIQATVDGIASLQELGAENFLVGLVPPVELAPIFSDQEFLDLLGVEPGFFDPVVEGYNEGLTAALEEYEVESGVNIEILDTNALFDSIAAEPGAYGFVNVDEPVLSSQTPVTGEPIEYNEAIVGEDPAVQHATLFLDPYFRPTALGHSIVAETARDELLNSGEDISESTPEETGLTVGLYDTHEDTLIAPLEDGTQIQASEVAGKNLGISASVPEDSVYSEVESVFLNLNDGQFTRTENVDPYALFGDNDGDYFQGGIDLQGEHTVAFELYSQDDLGGEMLGNMNVDFSIV